MLVVFLKVVGCGFNGGCGAPKRMGGQSRENNSLCLSLGPIRALVQGCMVLRMHKRMGFLFSDK